jgi:membrane protein DedA with SNARE-associated domain
MHDFILWLVDFVKHLGYFGIFVMTLIESTFVPIPAEVTMLPAGYLVQQGVFNFWLVLLSSVFGTVVGSYINYWLAKHHGRKLFNKYGKYLMMTPAKMEKLESFYEQHGSLSTFIGRLLPGLRHYISFPAGLAKMHLGKFFLYTGLGGAIWMAILLFIGYKIGDNEELARQVLPQVNVLLLVSIGIGICLYILKKMAAKRQHEKRTKKK